MIRISTLVWLILSIVTGSLLFNFGQKTEDQRHAIALLEKKIDREQQSLNILQAEWSYLNRPERLRALSDKHLDLEQIKRLPQLQDEDVDVISAPPEKEEGKDKQKSAKTTVHKDQGKFAFSKRLEDTPKPAPPPIKTDPKKSEKSFADVLQNLGGE